MEHLHQELCCPLQQKDGSFQEGKLSQKQNDPSAPRHIIWTAWHQGEGGTGPMVPSDTMELGRRWHETPRGTQQQTQSCGNTRAPHACHPQHVHMVSVPICPKTQFTGEKQRSLCKLPSNLVSVRVKPETRFFLAWNVQMNKPAHALNSPGQAFCSASLVVWTG